MEIYIDMEQEKSQLLQEVLHCAPTIILTILFCKHLSDVEQIILPKLFHTLLQSENMQNKLTWEYWSCWYEISC